MTGNTTAVDSWFVGATVAVFVVFGVVGAGCSPPSGGDDAGGDADATDGVDAGDDADSSSSGQQLISNSSWSKTSESDDPLASHRPGTVECPDDATGIEQFQDDDAWAVDTANCNYYSGEQSSLAGIEKGDQIEARLWHYELTSDTGAEAHVAILFGDEIAWETTVQIPKDGSVDSKLLAPSWTAESARDVGSTVRFHVHNHGSNEWTIIELKNADGP